MRAGRGMLTCGRGAGVDVGRCDMLAWGCVGFVGTRILLTHVDVGAGGVGTGIGGRGLLTRGRVGGCNVGAAVGALDVWTGGTSGVGGLLAVLLVVLSIVLVAVFVLLGVFILGLLVFLQFFVFVVFVPFVVGFSGREVGLSNHVIVGWCGLLARCTAKGLMWGCDADAAGGQHALSTNIEIKSD